VALELSQDRVLVDDQADLFEYAFEQGWTDGLPVVPPTRQRVERMIGDRDPSRVLGEIPPRLGVATVEKVAINAVMAGCKPEYFPVVEAALRALLHERFNLNAIHATTHSCGPLLIVNGPVTGKLGFNGGHNAFGQGCRANATVGRAIRLIGVNIGGAIPGEQDKSTQGHPGKYTFCIAENEAESPWEPFHVRRGFDRDQSVVTVFACEAPHSIGAMNATNAAAVLKVACTALANVAHNNSHVMGEALVALGPEHAHTIAASGWSVQDVQYYLWEHARTQLWKLRENDNVTQTNVDHYWAKWMAAAEPDDWMPIVKQPDDLLVMVAGGAGKFSSFLPGWGDIGSRSVSEVIDI
jgi:hypothetical protein